MFEPVRFFASTSHPSMVDSGRLALPWLILFTISLACCFPSSIPPKICHRFIPFQQTRIGQMILLGHQFWLVDPLAGIGISVWGTQHLTVAAVSWKGCWWGLNNLADTGWLNISNGGQQQFFAAGNFWKLTTETFEASLNRDETQRITLLVPMSFAIFQDHSSWMFSSTSNPHHFEMGWNHHWWLTDDTCFFVHRKFKKGSDFWIVESRGRQWRLWFCAWEIDCWGSSMVQRVQMPNWLLILSWM